jgi:SAM-dependent methyltransferase
MYGRDLAHVHDDGFGAFARDAAPALLALLRERGIRGGLVVDLGCGSGIWAAALLDAGYDVLGVDVSAEMLEIARRRAPRARFARGSLFDTPLPRCAAITSIGECVTYGSDRAAGRAAFVALLRRAHEALETGGLLVFDVVTPERPARRSWTEGEDWVVCADGRPGPVAGTYRREITTFRRHDGDDWRRSDEVHDVWVYDPADVLADLRAAGFAAAALDGYGENVRFAPGHAGFAAVRPGSRQA